MPEDPAFTLPPDPLLDSQTVEVYDDTHPAESVLIHGSFAFLGPWKEDLVLKIGNRAFRVDVGDVVSFHTIAKSNV